MRVFIMNDDSNLDRYELNPGKFRAAAEALRARDWEYISSDEDGCELWRRYGESATLYPCGRICDVELDEWLAMKARQRGVI